MMLICDDNVKVIYSDSKEIYGKIITTTYVAHNMKYEGQYLINDANNFKDLWVVTDIYRETLNNEKIIEKKKIELYYRPKIVLDEEYEILTIKVFIDGEKAYRTDWYDRDNKRFSYKTIEERTNNCNIFKKFEWVYNNPEFRCNNEKYTNTLTEQASIDEVYNNVVMINNELKEKKDVKQFQKVLK